MHPEIIDPLQPFEIISRHLTFLWREEKGTDLTSPVAVPRPLQGSGGDAWKLLQPTLLFPFRIAVFLLQLALHEWRDFSVLAGGSSRVAVEL